MNEVIQHYVNNRSNVYIMLLDCSKAFDRVHYVKLFFLLVNKGLCPLTARFLINLYTLQKVRVKWGSCLSKQVNISNGVEQGGTLSPILCIVYMDEMLVRLK